MSMSDARMLAELTARVAKLEDAMSAVEARLAEHLEGVDVGQEILGPVADAAARDGLRKMFRESREPHTAGAASEASLETPGIAYPKYEEPEKAAATDLSADPALKDRLAALQGGEAAKPAPKK